MVPNTDLPPVRSVQQLRAAKVHAFLAHARRTGIDLSREFSARDIPMALFEDPRGWITRDQCATAFDVIATTVPQDFGFQLGSSWTFNEFGLVGYGLLSCRTYGEFSDRWLDHIDFIGLPLAFRSVVKEGAWSLEMRPRIPLSTAALRMCVEEACASVFPIHRELCGRALLGTRIDLMDGAPGCTPPAAAMPDTFVRPGAPINRLVMRTANRLTKIHIARDVLQVFVERHCKPILPEITSQQEILGQVRNILLLSCGIPPESAAMAATLGTSKRSFNRRLACTGWTYNDLIERYRHDYALALLRSRELCTKEISYMLRFENPSSFRRAFHRWTGSSVGGWARAQLGQPPRRR